MKIMIEEIFGLIMLVMFFVILEEVVRLVNDIIYGLIVVVFVGF